MTFADTHECNLQNLLLNGEGQVIYISIEKCADRCLVELKEAEKDKEIEAEKVKQISATISEEIDAAKKTRFSLSSIDNKIKLNKQRNLPLKRYIFQRTQEGKPDSLELLLELMATADSDENSPEIAAAVNSLSHEIIQSLRLRIQMVWSWDAILNCHRQVLITRCLFQGRKLLEIAHRLQDEETIKQVNNLLGKLNLKIPQRSWDYSLPDSPNELWEMLRLGNLLLVKLCDYVHSIDSQRRELNDTAQTIMNQSRKSQNHKKTPLFPQPLHPVEEVPDKAIITKGKPS